MLDSGPEGGGESLATRGKSGCGGGLKLRLGILFGNFMLGLCGGMLRGLGLDLGIKLGMIEIEVVRVRMHDGGMRGGNGKQAKKS